MAIGSSQWMYNSGDYEIEQSLRFNDDDSAYLSRTPSVAGNRRTWTFSCWFKWDGKTDCRIFQVGASLGASNYFGVSSYGAKLNIEDAGGFAMHSAALLRDPSAWYHIVLEMDTTQSTAANRLKVYINGEQITTWANSETYPALNNETAVNRSGVTHAIGAEMYSGPRRFMDGYIAEVHLIDGTALTPSSFGTTGNYGEWKPKEYKGTYGTNGFYLPFKQDYAVEGFSAVTYKGTRQNIYIGGTGFKPDFVWMKSRGTSNHTLIDSLRGGDKALQSSTTSSENQYGSQNDKITAFNNDGFTLGVNAAGYGGNDAGVNHVAWCWDMGGTTASNTSGSITSSVRANPTYGQSIVTYTGNGSNAQTIGHGLSQAPDVVITKRRTSTTEWWMVWHSAVMSADDYWIALQSTGELRTGGETPYDISGFTSSTFGVHGMSGTNVNGATQVSYCFHDVTGYSKFGSYSGNGSSNAITTGFKPAFVMIKRTNRVGDSWAMFDNTRNPTNPVTRALWADTNGAEYVEANALTFTNTGFTVNVGYQYLNNAAGIYIYMAFADTREYAYWLDQSGNNNDWTSNNLTESDIMVDSPTNNFATLNPLDDSNTTLSEGNLKTVNGSSYKGARATMAFPSSGKWYAEYAEFSTRRSNVIGSFRVVGGGTNLDNNGGATGLYWGSSGLQVDNDGWFTGSPVDGIGSGDVLQMAYDSDTGKVWCGINNQWLRSSSGTLYTDGNPAGGSNQTYTWGSSAEDTFFSIWNYSLTGVANFGQDSSFAGNKTAQGNQDGNDIGDFYYAPPTGFLALCTKNLPSVDVIPSEHFNTVLYSGNGGTQSITGVGFAPDFVWLKSRPATSGQNLTNTISGATKYLRSDLTAAEGTANIVTAFGSDGFTVGDGNGQDVNKSGESVVAWNWKAGGTAVSNTNGSITSSVSANVDAGFSIVSYTGNDNATTNTIGHGLSKAPEIVFSKRRNTGGYHWMVGYNIDGTAHSLYLNDTFARDNELTRSPQAFTATTFRPCTVGSNPHTNGIEPYIAYCFHSVDGYSKVGTYVGNGNANGPFVHCGFRPAWVMIKRTDNVSTWSILDSARDTFNSVEAALYADNTTVENDEPSLGRDYLSNGFKLTGTYSGQNTSGGTYIFLAFAESPFKHSNAR